MRMLDNLARLAVISVVVAAAGGAEAQVKDFGDGDWTVGCDNVRTCIAIGVAPEGADVPAYIKVSRSGEAEAKLRIDVVVSAEDATADSLLLRLAFDDPAIPGLPPEPLAAKRDDDYPWGFAYRATLVGAPAQGVISGFRKASNMVLTPVAGQTAGTPAVVSLSGAVAALLFMDDRQKRAGTVTALVGRGSKPASAVPAPPPLPSVAAKPIEPLKQLPPVPKDLPKPNADCPNVSRPIGSSRLLAARLSPSLTIWGVCREEAGYGEITFDLYLVGDGKVAEARVEPPPGEKTAAVVDPYFPTADTVVSNSKARAIGDCGRSETWAWDGASFRLLSVSEMGH